MKYVCKALHTPSYALCTCCYPRGVYQRSKKPLQFCRTDDRFLRQKFSVSFEELYCFDIARSLARSFPNYIILFVLLGLLPLRALSKFMTRHVLIETVSTYFLFASPFIACSFLWEQQHG